MNYSENCEKFYSSDYAIQIVDNWVTGIPFLMEYKNGIYDAFLLYSCDTYAHRFQGVKMLVIVDVATEKMECLTDNLDLYSIENNFLYETNSFSNIEEYLDLKNKLQEAYVNLRNDFVSTCKFDIALQELYLKLVNRIVPKRIVEKVYAPLSPKLFTEK